MNRTSKRNITLLSLICLMVFSIQVMSQEAVTPPKPPPASSKEKKLPEIQLKDYTIVGLAKISLPRKHRTRTQKKLEIQWTANPDLLQKEPPAISFQFSRIKPSLLRLYEFPWLNSEFRYGSFNTAMLKVATQFSVKNTLPYLAMNYGRSDGHVDNADWTAAGVQAGARSQLAEGILFDAGTQYQFRKQGIWRNYPATLHDWETQSTRWKWYLTSDQKWSTVFRTAVDGTYFIDDHKNYSAYRDRGWDASARAIFQWKPLGIAADLRHQQTKLTQKPNQSASSVTAGTWEDMYEGSVLSTGVVVRPRWNIFTVGVGFQYQDISESVPGDATIKKGESEIQPNISFQAGLNGIATLTVRYRPGWELWRMRRLVRLLPFSDIMWTGLLKYKNHIESGLTLHPFSGLNLVTSFSFAKVENYPVPVFNPVYQQTAANTLLGSYPTWFFNSVQEVDLKEAHVNLVWDLTRALSLSGWINLRKSKIISSSPVQTSAGNTELPYYPNISGTSRLSWTFYREHLVFVSVQYVGQRYDDLDNNRKVDDFILLNAGALLKLSRTLKFSIDGRNLLDTGYSEWYGFPGPGIAGYLGVKLDL